MSKLKDHLPALVAAVVIVVLIACTCRVTYIPDPVQETTFSTDAENFFCSAS